MPTKHRLVRPEEVAAVTGGDSPFERPVNRLGVIPVGRHVCKTLVQTGVIVRPRVVVRHGSFVTRFIPLPRRHAGHDPAGDRPHASSILIALAVAEPNTVDSARITSVIAATVCRCTRRTADTGPPTSTTIVTKMIAIEVVPWAATVTDIAEPGSVGFPPTRHNGVGRAQVVTGQLAAEIGVPIATEGTTITIGASAGTNGRMGSDRPNRESDWRHSQRGCSESGTGEKAASRRPVGNHTTQSVDDSPTHRSVYSPST